MFVNMAQPLPLKAIGHSPLENFLTDTAKKTKPLPEKKAK